MKHWSDDLCAIVAIVAAMGFGLIAFWLWFEVIF